MAQDIENNSEQLEKIKEFTQRNKKIDYCLSSSIISYFNW